MCLNEPARFGLCLLSLNSGFCVGPWCSVDGVGCVFGLLLLPHAAEKSVYTFLKSL